MFHIEHAKCYAHALHASFQATVKSLFDSIYAAMKPPSSLAALTKSYSWRDQVRKAIDRAGVEIKTNWFDLELKAQHDSEESLKPVEQQWRMRVREMSDECARVSEIMSAKHDSWVSTGRIELARDLYERRLSLLTQRRVPLEDRIQVGHVESAQRPVAQVLGPVVETRRGGTLFTERHPARAVERCAALCAHEGVGSRPQQHDLCL